MLDEGSVIETLLDHQKTVILCSQFQAEEHRTVKRLQQQQQQQHQLHKDSVKVIVKQHHFSTWPFFGPALHFHTWFKRIVIPYQTATVSSLN